MITAVLCLVATIYQLATTHDVFQSIHSILSITLCLIMVLSACIFAVMRRFKYRLQIHVDFVWCTALWILASYVMITEVSNDNTLFFHCLIGWSGFVVLVFLGLAVYSWLTSDAI